MSYRGLSQSTIVITGAARGIGAAIAAHSAQAGANLVLADLNATALGKTAADLRAGGASVIEHAIDITDAASVQQMAADTEKRFGKIDGLANVAAILYVENLLEQDQGNFARTMQVNITGTFLVTQAVGQVMARQKRGSIVTIGSVAGKFPRMHQGAYCTSKAAQIMLTHAFGLELAASGVRCNCVSPGPTETDMVRDLIAQFGSADRFIHGVPEEFRGGMPLGQMIRPDSLASAVLWLLSDDSAQVTMQHIAVDGGQSLGI
ncbi:MAG: SDR family oxidoreductase [Burkholderiales bacterium]